MMHRPKTIRFWRNHLPHWQVEAGVYFITMRAAGSLPKAVGARIAEIHASMSAIEPASADYLELQRRYFLTLEKYLDAGYGFCPFKHVSCCQIVKEAMFELSSIGWNLQHYAIMPNHVHLLIQTDQSAAEMSSVWRSWKGRTARWCNQELQRRGAFWQRDWFDRWMRDEASLNRTVDYIRNNPVKAGLARQWQDYPWVH
ncbi:transposase [Coraliomargarita algicola]|uniref:Transposase n=1 Tax=Coraliomargarita algicola TaxID=3092156 RepID=A0ABZ0RNL0_9BACT|nr:transposase [Coraliomargarita sp. J2-16]WPJ97107.1 transposase [Coraliomargarita sp. J2-16]